MSEEYVDPFAAGQGTPPPAAQAQDSPAPAVEQAIERAVHEQDVRLAWEGHHEATVSRELGLGGARGIRARMLMHQPAYDPGISEKAYVAYQVEMTKTQMKMGLLTDHDGLRLERARLYAQNRYRQFMLGQVASL